MPSPSFALLGLPRPLISALARRDITEPFPIQSACIPDALEGRDVLGRGQTGSGKTLAFGLPMLARVAGDPAAPGRPRGLILVPTRELAMQVQDALESLGRGLCVRMKTVVGGTSMGKQISALRRGVEVLVATPGRLTDLIERGACSLADIEVTVLDEADQMADMGFLPAITKLLDQVPADGQRLLFSATLDRDVDTLVKRYLHEPVTHSLAPATASVDTMAHHMIVVEQAEKAGVTAEIAGRNGRTIMFVRTKHGVDKLSKHLARAGVRAGALHGGKTQNKRTRTLAEFREGKIGVLVATDVAARGIHVDDVSLVLHVDPPGDHKAYLHRAGRTARAGESGSVATLVTPREVRPISRLMQRAGITAERTRVTAGDAELVRITGARRPSGIPVPEESAPPAERRGKAAARHRTDRRRSPEGASASAGNGSLRGDKNRSGRNRRRQDQGAEGSRRAGHDVRRNRAGRANTGRRHSAPRRSNA